MKIHLDEPQDRGTSPYAVLMNKPSDPASLVLSADPSTSKVAGAGPLFIVINAGSGSHGSEDVRQVLGTVFSEAGREHRFLLIEQATAIADTAREALRLAKAADGVVVAAGGDGTINAVAQVVRGSGVPFGVLPQGTFNYFGRVHGIPQDSEAAARALLRARVEPTQVGLVNDQAFLVNASLGLYPKLLEERELFKKQFGRSRVVAMVSALWTLARQGRQLKLSIEMQGETRELRTPTLFVGNNALQLQRLGFAEAAALERGRLAAIAVSPIGSLQMMGLVLRGALGRLGDAEQVTSTAFRKLTVRTHGQRMIKVGIDGEIHRMRSPLVFSIDPDGLLLLTPLPEDRAEIA